MNVEELKFDSEFKTYLPVKPAKLVLPAIMKIPNGELNNFRKSILHEYGVELKHLRILYYCMEDVYYLVWTGKFPSEDVFRFMLKKAKFKGFEMKIALTSYEEEKYGMESIGQKGIAIYC